jgi:hypothetical protein
MTCRALATSVIAVIGLAACRPAGALAGPGPGDRMWTWDAAAGYDSYTHTYALATADTTETVSESLVQLGLEGRSAPGARGRWRLRLEASAGTELWRERLEADWRRVDAGGVGRVRALARAGGYQYRSGADGSQSSDQADGRLDLQAVPLAGAGSEMFLAGWGSATDFARSSPLEQDMRELGLGAGVRSRGWQTGMWTFTLRHAARAYPDSASIDRRTWSAEADLSRNLGSEGSVRLYERSERRLAADPQVRPDAWFHWLDAAAQVPALASLFVVEWQYERWDYDVETGTWLDSWRLAGLLDLRRGDVMRVQWLVGLAAEWYDAGASPETYEQAGLRAGLESYGSRLSGTCTVEHGRRRYADQADAASDLAYSDFDYWRLWLMADYRLTDGLVLSALGSWEPESHAEPQDDVSLGFASLRLVWRP